MSFSRETSFLLPLLIQRDDEMVLKGVTLISIGPSGCRKDSNENDGPIPFLSSDFN